jgi:hypothetical protein
VTIPATVPQGSEIPEGLMNNPVFLSYSLIFVVFLECNKIPLYYYNTTGWLLLK